MPLGRDCLLAAKARAADLQQTHDLLPKRVYAGIREILIEKLRNQAVRPEGAGEPERPSHRAAGTEDR